MAQVNFQLPREIKVDIKVTGVTEMKARIWLGCQLIKAAAKLMGGVGCIEVEVKREPVEGPRP